MAEERRISPAVVIGIGAGIGIAAAVALYAVARAAPPTPPPGLANVYGKVKDATTGEAIADATVTLDSYSTSSAANGKFTFLELEPGDYHITVEKGGYEMVSEDITLTEGNNELSVQMVPVLPPGRFNLYGVVTDAETGYPIEGVKVTIGAQVTYTNSSGAYAFESLRPPGTYTITFEKEGYEAVSEDKTVVEGNNELNVTLTPIVPALANLYGIVTDADTGYPIGGVKVTINGVVTYTNSSGAYAFEGLDLGSYTITFEKDGYETITR